MPPIQELRRNEQIRISPILVIGENNDKLGIMPTDQALRLARDSGLDLVEVQPNVRPPVCRLMDYGKWKYQQKKKTSRSHEPLFKEVRLRPRTDEHDLAIKIKHALGFFEKGAKVQFTMRFRGRERAHREIALNTLRDILSRLGNRVRVERPPTMDGRNMVMVLSPLKGAQAPEAKPARPAAAPSGAGSAGPTVAGSVGPPWPTAAPEASAEPPSGGATGVGRRVSPAEMAAVPPSAYP